jgi:hypothetical protein
MRDSLNSNKDLRDSLLQEPFCSTIHTMLRLTTGLITTINTVHRKIKSGIHLITERRSALPPSGKGFFVALDTSISENTRLLV